MLLHPLIKTLVTRDNPELVTNGTGKARLWGVAAARSRGLEVFCKGKSMNMRLGVRKTVKKICREH